MLVARLTCLRGLPLVGLRPVLSQGSPALRSPILKACPPLLRPQQVLETSAFTVAEKSNATLSSHCSTVTHSLLGLVLSEIAVCVYATLSRCVTCCFFFRQGFSAKARFGFRRGKSARDQLKEAAFEPATETFIKGNKQYNELCITSSS